MKKKNRIAWRLFRWNILIVSALLTLQLIFQSALFEPFLATMQQRQLSTYMGSVKASIENDDMDLAQQLVQKADEHGVVLAAVDKNMNFLAGQSVDLYQRCFTLSDKNQKRYTIIEDYLESDSLQAIEVGDQVSIEGYLIDENNNRVIPSKVYRTKDGAVLGTDTFLLVNNQGRSYSTESTGDETGEDEVIFSEPQSEQNAGDAVASGTTQQPGSTVVTKEAEDENQTNLEGSSDENVTVKIKDESNLPQGILLESPFDSTESSAMLQNEGVISSSSDPSGAILNARVLIVNGSGRGSASYSITLDGTVEEKEDFGNDDLLIPYGLVAKEIDRLGTSNTEFNINSSSYTVTKQLTTGKYLLIVTRVADRNVTLLGAISLYSIKDINEMLNSFHILLYSLGLILFAGLIYIFSRKIAKPLIEMNVVALKIAQQDFSTQVQVSTNDEFTTLGNSINEISLNLEQKIKQINEMNAQLQRDYERQLELYKRHKQLSAAYSHEIKTPLTIVRGYIDGIQDGVYSNNLKESYQIALRELDSASNMITQMLEITKMESPYFVLNQSVVDLWMIFYKTYDALKQTMDQKGLQVAFEANSEAITVADTEMLETVMTNALTNAWKYSPQNSRISVRIMTEKNQLLFSIENEGAHIPNEELGKVWQPFYRAKETKTNHASGSGLGLVIAREILETHGFAYGLRNTERGVEFYFTCPAMEPTIDQEPMSEN
ncbi:MAG TPA: HAMP domain-containing sensor histidine kinase [Negativicutes bacterium]|nr:HAMP domain-containing sensor histidine kinase [Negativicutes bacterium]